MSDNEDYVIDETFFEQTFETAFGTSYPCEDTLITFWLPGIVRMFAPRTRGTRGARLKR